ncbi:oxidoreductase [Erwinia persicina]|uniref:oxidoreductase n=1 Tax=Erwinia persicina TaxID=55211 RepID=UPI002109A771|nr:oxidoreductase [Erwinia persicina]MCQ4095361.1 oxidoreductase [Erwinia persicina]MCQ4098856.1 oxidoreductase [Erwinia persicina]
MSKVWFITGATRGIGADIAKAALAEGDKVVATGRQKESVTRALGSSEHLLALSLDVTDEQQAQATVQAAISHFKQIDIVVNNAGFAVLGALEETTNAEVRRQFDTNVFGLLNVTRAVLPVMRARKSGHIFNLSSLAGFYGDAGVSSYCGTKFAVEGISESLAKEVAPLGIHVTIVEPGYFRTEFLTENSVVYTDNIIAAYDATSGETRRATRAVDGKQANDPKKLAQALLRLANEQQPPLRFTAGADATEIYDRVLVEKKHELDLWRTLSDSLAF